MNIFTLNVYSYDIMDQMKMCTSQSFYWILSIQFDFFSSSDCILYHAIVGISKILINKLLGNGFEFL